MEDIKLSEQQMLKMGITETIKKFARRIAKEELKKHTHKTWIVIEWECCYSRFGKGYEETPGGKRAIKLYCIETEETKDI